MIIIIIIIPRFLVEFVLKCFGRYFTRLNFYSIASFLITGFFIFFSNVLVYVSPFCCRCCAYLVLDCLLLAALLSLVGSVFFCQWRSRRKNGCRRVRMTSQRIAGCLRVGVSLHMCVCAKGIKIESVLLFSTTFLFLFLSLFCNLLVFKWEKKQVFKEKNKIYYEEVNDFLFSCTIIHFWRERLFYFY